MATQLLVIAGEASGDLHGGHLLRELKKRQPDLTLVGIGGGSMTPYLDEKIADLKDLGVVGFLEILRHLPRLWQLKQHLHQRLSHGDIHDVLFIDYPGFNLRLAQSFRRAFPHVRLHHYVCPQVWAWRPQRIPLLGQTLTTLYCLFPFEVPLFKNYAVRAVCLGHPLLDWVKPEVSRDEFFNELRLDPSRPFVTLLPGSRPEEIRRLLPAMAAMVSRAQRDRPTLQWVLALAPTISIDLVNSLIHGLPIHVVTDRSYASRAYAEAAVVASGTATLETALLKVPFLAVYRLHPFSFWMAKHLVKLPYFSLANVVMGSKIIPELLQKEVQSETLWVELKKILGPEGRAAQMGAMTLLRERLGHSGAMERIAEDLLEQIRGSR
jgi:lipid-A-disaccharide synthase